MRKILIRTSLKVGITVTYLLYEVSNTSYRSSTCPLAIIIDVRAHARIKSYGISGFGDTFDETMHDFSSSFMADVKCWMHHGSGAHRGIENLMGCVSEMS